MISGPSDRNVRKTSPDPEDALGLQTAIDRQGLHLPLILEHRSDGRTRYKVLAGGQRYAALMKNAEDPDSEITLDTLIPCRIPTEPIADSVAVQISLSENENRTPLNPIDASDAYVKLSRNGLSVDDIAIVMGATPRMVRSRLVLQTLHPDIRQAGREGILNFTRLAAYAACPDANEQYGYFVSVDPSTTPDEIRAALIGNPVLAQDPRVRFITVKQYLASGGTFEPDLFTDEDGSRHSPDSRLSDPQLLNTLVARKLHDLENQLSAEGWSWTASFTSNHDFVVESISWIHTRPRRGDTFSPREHASLGATVHIDRDGRPVYTRGLNDTSRHPANTAAPARPAPPPGSVPPGASVAAAPPAGHAGPAAAAPAAPAPAPSFNRALLTDLDHVRRIEFHAAALASPAHTAAWAFAESALRLAAADAPLALSTLKAAPRYDRASVSAAGTPLIASARQTSASPPALADHKTLAKLFLSRFSATDHPPQIAAVAAAYASAITNQTAAGPEASLAFADWIGYDWASWRPPLEFWLRIPRMNLSHHLSRFAPPADQAQILHACQKHSHATLCDAVHQAAVSGNGKSLSKLAIPSSGDIARRLNSEPAPGYRPSA